MSLSIWATKARAHSPPCSNARSASRHALSSERPTMPIGKLDHYSVRTLDIEASRRFYTEIMGFEVGFRPNFDFPGLWLYNGAQYPESTGVVHIIGIDLANPEGLKAY